MLYAVDMLSSSSLLFTRRCTNGFVNFSIKHDKFHVIFNGGLKKSTIDLH